MKNIHHDKMQFTPEMKGWFNIRKPIRTLLINLVNTANDSLTSSYVVYLKPMLDCILMILQ